MEKTGGGGDKEKTTPSENVLRERSRQSERELPDAGPRLGPGALTASPGKAASWRDLD